MVSNLAPDMAGGVYVVWLTGAAGGPIYRLIRILGNGAIAPGWPVGGVILAVVTDFESMDGFCTDGNGGIYLVWTSPQHEVLMLHYAGDGSVAPGWSSVGRPVVSTPSTKAMGLVEPTLEGGMLISWIDSPNGPGLGVIRYAIKILPSGDPDPSWPAGGVQVNSLATANGNSFMISDGSGGAFIGWNDNRNGISPAIPLDFEIYGQHLLGSGEIDDRWPSDGLPICVAPSAQYFFEMAEDGSGGALFVWDDYRNLAQIYATRVRADGTLAPGWTLNGAPMAPSPSSQTIPDGVADGIGGVFGFWYETRAGEVVVGQHFNASGVPASGWTVDGRVLASEAAASYRHPTATSDGKGGAIVAYERALPFPEPSQNIYVQRVLGDTPVSTRLFLLDQEVGPGWARLRWSASDASQVHARVYRSTDGFAWTALDAPTLASPSVLIFEDQDLVPGRYAYRLGSWDQAEEAFTEDVWLEVPSSWSLQLAGFRPNPSVGAPSLSFTLPDADPARLEVFDVKGRLVSSREVGGLGSGVHVVSLSGEGRWDAGVYWARLTQSGQTLTTKGLVAR